MAAARVQGGSAAAGQDQAYVVVHNLGSNLLVDPQVSVVRGGNEARVEVSGYAEQLIPFLHLTVDVVATGPVEPGGGR